MTKKELLKQLLTSKQSAACFSPLNYVNNNQEHVGNVEFITINIDALVDLLLRKLDITSDELLSDEKCSDHVIGNSGKCINCGKK